MPLLHCAAAASVEKFKMAEIFLATAVYAAAAEDAGVKKDLFRKGCSSIRRKNKSRIQTLDAWRRQKFFSEVDKTN